MERITELLTLKGEELIERKKVYAFLGNVADLFKPFVYGAEARFGEDLVFLRVYPSFTFEINYKQNIYQLKLKEIIGEKGKFQFYFKIITDNFNGESEEALETITTEMTENEIEEKIEISLKYFLKELTQTN